MESVMLSMQPRWAEKILNGEKTVEVRKTKPKLAIPFKCYIYQTKRNWVYEILHWLGLHQGKVVAEFICDDIKPIFPVDYTCQSDISYKTCLTNQEVAEYSNFKRIYGLHISDLVIYDKPKHLSEFGLRRPPQSWQYLK